MSLSDSILETGYIKPIIKEKDIIQLAEYRNNKLKYSCDFCKNVLINPVMCSKCKTMFCKDCIFPYVMTNNKCFKKCEDFELLIPSQELIELYKKFNLICRTCNAKFPLLNYYQHNKKCQANKKQVQCWNCNQNVNAEKLKYPTQAHYTLIHEFNNFLNFEDDKPFLLEISTDDTSGFATTKGNKLYFEKDQKYATLFSEITVKERNYLKILINDEWKFLSVGFFGISISSWDSCSSISIDKENEIMTLNDALFFKGKNLNLVLRITDKKLYFDKVSDIYQSCKVKTKYLENI